MLYEIEKKFIVMKEWWDVSMATSHHSIVQGFLLNTPEMIVRVRIQDDSGFLTIKGKQINATRPEFEYKIPVEDARALLAMKDTPIIEKTRHLVTYKDKTWEVDEFHGENQGLIIAELELENEEETFEKPVWAGKDVTEDFKYTNAQLCLHPFSKWPME